jgi:hypothetical protein
MTALRAFAVCTVLVLTVSCADITPPIESCFTPDQNTVVIYGRFELEQNQDTPGFCLDIYNRETKKEQFIPFRRIDPVYCVVSENGRCEIIGVALINQITHRVFRYQLYQTMGPFSVSYVIPFEAQRGSAIYVGDVAGFFNNPGLEMRFGIRKISDNFAETTSVFHEKYPHLTSLPVRSIFEQTKQADITPIPITIHLPPPVPVPVRIP